MFDTVNEIKDSGKKDDGTRSKNLEPCVMAQKTADETIAPQLRIIWDANGRLGESVTDLQARSMSDNLIFSGIPEERGEDAETVIQNLIQWKFKPERNISF